jgi:hypothetical protein
MEWAKEAQVQSKKEIQLAFGNMNSIELSMWQKML